MPCLPKHQQGFSLTEVLIAVALAGMVVVAAGGGLLYGVKMSKEAGRKNQALMLAEEGLVATQNIRDAAYTNLTNGTFGLATTSNQWNLSGASDNTGIFTRTITIADAGTGKKQVTSAVSWTEVSGTSRTISLVDYLSDWLSATSSPWNTPALAGSVNLSASQAMLKVATSGNYVYGVRSVASGVNFFVFDISTPTAPTQVGSMTLSGTPENIALSGNYVYVSSSDNNQELQIINISTPTAPSLTAVYDANNAQNATGIAVSGNYAYLTRDQGAGTEFLVLNITTPTAPTLTGSLELTANCNEVAVSGNYAYVASESNTQELQVVNITTPATPTLLGWYDLLASTANAETVAVNGTTVYLGINNVLYILSDAVHGTPTISGSIGLTGLVNDLALLSTYNYLFVGTSNASNEFRIINVGTPSSPTILGSVNLAGNVIGVAYNESLDVVAVADASSAAEFMVINHP